MTAKGGKHAHACIDLIFSGQRTGHQTSERATMRWLIRPFNSAVTRPATAMIPTFPSCCEPAAHRTPPSVDHSMRTSSGARTFHTRLTLNGNEDAVHECGLDLSGVLALPPPSSQGSEEPRQVSTEARQATVSTSTLHVRRRAQPARRGPVAAKRDENLASGAERPRCPSSADGGELGVMWARGPAAVRSLAAPRQDPDSVRVLQERREENVRARSRAAIGPGEQARSWL